MDDTIFLSMCNAGCSKISLTQYKVFLLCNFNIIANGIFINMLYWSELVPQYCTGPANGVWQLVGLRIHPARSTTNANMTCHIQYM
ncbi:hypothetical protein GDO86_013051 [Hymenochirus boettgeri]|uniref:Uncharacterized protein n=1 Tax=Hymenochirus boettgeri TaxID=247094 RepID=A0A8T2IPT3_9PIPI|nr:hypothetical protein GDO86_013051 [Hymenochirus boettgeri]